MTPHHETLDWSKSFMYRIHQTHFLIEKHLEQRLSDEGAISFSQFLVLMPLHCRDHASQSEIADALFLTEATVSRHVHTLTEEGLIASKDDPENRRKHILTLTAKGKKAFMGAQALLEASLREIFGAVPESERTVITRTFDQITHHLTHHAS